MVRYANKVGEEAGGLLRAVFSRLVETVIE